MPQMHLVATSTATVRVGHGDENFNGVPDLQKITDEYRRGATVALPAIHRSWTPLWLLCDRIETQLDHPAHAHVYITPGNASRFTPHYDVHEVLVLQIAGKKRWSIYAPVVPLPYRSQLFTPQAYAGQRQSTRLKGERTMLEFRGVRYQLPAPVASTLRAMVQLYVS
jgi:Cupin superfamily protein